MVLAVWSHDLFGIPYSAFEPSILKRPVCINYFAHHTIRVNGKTYEHTLMCCPWFQLHPNKDVYGKQVTIWENSILKNLDIFTIEKCISVTPINFTF